MIKDGQDADVEDWYRSAQKKIPGRRWLSWFSGHGKAIPGWLQLFWSVRETPGNQLEISPWDGLVIPWL
jgi:hypothetical protein